MHISLDTKNIIPNPFRSSSRVLIGILICNYFDIMMIFCELEIIFHQHSNPTSWKLRQDLEKSFIISFTCFEIKNKIINNNNNTVKE